MKKKILIAFIAVTSVFGAQAQEKKADRSEKMLEYKIKFIEEKLALTEKEKTDFIPIYKFKKVLPIKKVAQLYEAERAFKKELLDKLKDKKGEEKGEGKGKREGERSMSPSSAD